MIACGRSSSCHPNTVTPQPHDAIPTRMLRPTTATGTVMSTAHAIVARSPHYRQASDSRRKALVRRRPSSLSCQAPGHSQTPQATNDSLPCKSHFVSRPSLMASDLTLPIRHVQFIAQSASAALITIASRSRRRAGSPWASAEHKENDTRNAVLRGILLTLFPLSVTLHMPLARTSSHSCESS